MERWGNALLLCCHTFKVAINDEDDFRRYIPSAILRSRQIINYYCQFSDVKDTCKHLAITGDEKIKMDIVIFPVRTPARAWALKQ